ncbi:GroES-like protein [Polyplosphaeria fusca]|uniref:GroES-like protein n=1 Tax=Polyplosphaeria fusca TaxID=682080 RepID=A0A9P4QWA6_9PLEO|nr:GroES-like protein [Polyplosphaeria fusca]
MANRAAFLETEKGEFTVRDTEIGQPGDGEILIKVHAAAIQPADAKVAKMAVMKMEYPTTLGSPVAGTVEAIGTRTTGKVSIGDRVVCGTKIFVHKKAKYGGLQRYCVVDESEIVEIGTTPFPLAVTLASYTPPGALFGSSTLNLHRPSLPPSPLPPSEQGKKILIWGGSSAMGALSISYAKAAGYTVISTCSAHNIPLLQSLGADHVLDHSAADTVQRVRGLLPIAYWFDTVSLKPSISSILNILAPEGGEVIKAHVLLLLPLVMAGVKEEEFPEGVTAGMLRFSTHAEENREWNRWLLAKGGFLERGIKSGAIRGVPPTVVGGLERVGEGIEMVHKGVSGTKVVVEPWA